MTNSNLLEQIPAQDWEATPASVRNLLLSLLPQAEEATQQHDGVETLANNRSLACTEDTHTPEEEQIYKERLRQYHALVNRSFAPNFTTEEAAEMERLGKEIDAYNAPFYAPMLRAIRAVQAENRE